MTNQPQVPAATPEERERICEVCLQPIATEADYERYDEGEGEHLCWEDPMVCDEVAEEKGLRDIRLTPAEIKSTIAELDAMGHSKPGEHAGPVDERCPACDVLDKLRAASPIPEDEEVR